MSLDIRNDQSNTSPEPVKSFAETALRLGGKSEDEAHRTGVIDAADDQVEAMFAPRYQTTSSPVHRAVWDADFSTSPFYVPVEPVPSAAGEVMDRSMDVVRDHLQNGTIYDGQGKLSDSVLRDLGTAGYWGMLVNKRYGGSGLKFQHFAQFLTRMATLEPTVAGLASVHGCIGAVDPVRSFGTSEQKSRFLPSLASGDRLSAFALTEPGAGSDLTALKTVATRDGDDYVVNGEKLFITNAMPGRTIGLVCKIDGIPAVLVAELPETENDSFYMKQYGLYALRRTHNNGLVFKNFRIPVSNRLQPAYGDGLTIAYHGLNLGRVSLCANASGTMRSMLASMLPWGSYRRTYGQSIDQRELVQRRIGRLAGFIVSCDALVQWCAGLIDQGYRGEMECIIAKIFGSEAQKEAAIEFYMKTCGGRSFLHGHTFGDNVHEYLAPCIYEGEGEMLGMAFFKSLVKHHGKQYFEPIGQILSQRNISSPNPLNPLHGWYLKQPLMRYASWFVRRHFTSRTTGAQFPVHHALAHHARFAQRRLSRACFEISGMMRKHQLRLADRQCSMSQLSGHIQDTVTMLCTCLYASSQSDPITRDAAAVSCDFLKHRILGTNPTDRDFRRVTSLGRKIVNNGWNPIAQASAEPILMQYRQ